MTCWLHYCSSSQPYKLHSSFHLVSFQNQIMIFWGEKSCQNIIPEGKFKQKTKLWNNFPMATVRLYLKYIEPLLRNYGQPFVVLIEQNWHPAAECDDLATRVATGWMSLGTCFRLARASQTHNVCIQRKMLLHLSRKRRNIESALLSPRRLQPSARYIFVPVEAGLSAAPGDAIEVVIRQCMTSSGCRLCRTELCSCVKHGSACNQPAISLRDRTRKLLLRDLYKPGQFDHTFI